MEKQSHVEVSVKEQILILKSYRKNNCKWPEVYKEVKLAVVKENLAENIQQMYTEKPYEKIKRRIADEVQNYRLPPARPVPAAEETHQLPPGRLDPAVLYEDNNVENNLSLIHI